MKISNIVIAILFFFIMSSLSFSQEQTCCSRSLAVLRPDMPPDQYTDWGGYIDASIAQIILNEIRHSDCPLKMDLISLEGRAELNAYIKKLCAHYKIDDPSAELHEKKMMDIDYLFKPELIAVSVTGKSEVQCEEGYGGEGLSCFGGDLKGKFTLKLSLFDHNNNEELKAGQISWTGDISDWGGYHDQNDKTSRFDYISGLVTTFMPLKELILNHEKTPESCEIEFPEEQEEVLVGDEINIIIKNIKDFKGENTRTWQHIIARVDEGKILNGKTCWGDDNKLFEVNDGSIEIKYQAPEDCNKQTDIIHIYNTCNIKPYDAMINSRYPLEKEILNKEFKIICVQGYIDYNHKIDFDYEAFSQTVTITGSVPFKLEESAEGTQGKQKVKGKGTVNLSLIWTAEDCVGRSDSPGEIKFEGEIINENEEKFIDIKFDEKWYQNAVLTVTCPEITKNVPMVIPPPVKYEKMKFKFKDGEKITRPFAGMGGNGTYSWTIRLPNSTE